MQKVEKDAYALSGLEGKRFAEGLWAVGKAPIDS